ncbi:phosphoketolase family protein [Amycolatopsis rubida]|uniref:Phosphoketolase family protein n=1 Tax=Amycolatopsis rubida TaxID=112413 RepID=A0ABX0BUG0_9PSEU|nr:MULTISPECIES: phosphoketolase family protein [Amycolatopsis]MYW94192.1 phosphoketolase [Amycolatopsis rubida]NEC59181.1 phosphoketolase family protein [Amycolatopsis rubida]OAP20878.1 Xylulose-5-phosphate/fructose-6-phosphate phosphoketolase [Amycolatopsis sp. M39]
MPGTLRRYRRACDYLAAAMIHLKDNVLLTEPLRPEHLKPRPLGHWGTCPGLTLIYAGLNRLVADTGQRTLLITGPGHGAPAIHANLWLEGTHAEYDPRLSLDGHGLAELVRRFSWPGGFPSHLSPEVPGVIHEGGELGYALATAFGAAFDDPGLLVACVVGDGEAETGPAAGSWHSPKFTGQGDGRVLPILHLNGYKIASPTIYETMSDDELTAYFTGCGWTPLLADVRDTDDPDTPLADALARAHAQDSGPPPMIVLRSTKGMGLPATSPDGTPLEGTFHAHQVPLPGAADDPDQIAELERWLRSYRPEELFDADGVPADDLLAVPPEPSLRLGRVPQANGGQLRRDLPLPGLGKFAVEVTEPGADQASPTEVLGSWLAELVRQAPDTFRVVCPDELESNQLGALLEVTDRQFGRDVRGYTEHLGRRGRVLEVLSEHLCQGWLQGYLLTGRHGLFPCYEAFVSIVDSMVNQYAKFLKMSGEVPWRAPVASLNYLLTSDGWRQEHNGYSHQGPGFINQMLTKKADTARIYFPPDANTLLETMYRCLSSTDLINVVVAGKRDGPVWLSPEQARAHCRAGATVWPWAGHEGEADVVLACAGTTPTVETLAAAQLLADAAPDLRVRVVNVVDLLSLCPADRHPNGLSEEAFTECFGDNVPVIFAFHGYPSAVHEVLHGRRGAQRFHVHGYLEEGTTTTPFALLASNRMTRHDLAADAVGRARGWSSAGGDLARGFHRRRDELLALSYRDGEDPAEITGWRWPR